MYSELLIWALAYFLQVVAHYLNITKLIMSDIE